MTRIINRSITIMILVTSFFLATLRAQADVIEIQPLFEYPVAPEEIQSLGDKSNWLMQHFWDQMDFKKNSAVDQTALNDAFRVYTLPMQWADKVEVNKSVDNILSKISKNPTLLLQFTKAAEENLYSSRARIWIDEVYVKFLEAFLKSKKFTKTRKLRYQEQLKRITNSMIGNKAPTFNFVTPTGNPGKYEPIGVFTIIEFGDPDCDDCRHAKLKMETDMQFTSLVDRGLVNVLFIIPDPVEGWQTNIGDYPSNWIVGASDDVSDILDIRTSPSFYVIDKEGNIVAKNVFVEQAKKLAMQQDTAK